MANKKLGVKRECPNCSVKFYDLNKTPAICPKCEHSFTPAKATKTKKERVEQTKAAEKEAETAQPTEAENPSENEVTFEEADAENVTASSNRNPGLDEEEEIDENNNFIASTNEDDNGALLATDDEDNEDVSSMVDVDISVDN